MKKTVSLTILLCITGLFTSNTAVLGDQTIRQEPGVWKVDDFARSERASGWTFSADGRLAVWIRSTVEKVDKEEKRVANLWLTHLGEGRSMPLTRGTDTVSDPAISPDGRRVAFLSTRPLPGKKDPDSAKTQVWSISLEAGESQPLTRLGRDVEAFGWIDPDTLVVLAPETRSAWERERQERGDTTVVVEDADRKPPVRLFRLDRATGKVRRLTRNRDWIESLVVSPDGRFAVVTARQSLSYDFDQKTPPHTYLVDLQDGSMKRIFQDDVVLPEEVRWASDSSGVFVSNEYTRHPRYRMATITDLHFFDRKTGRTSRVELDWHRGLGGGFAPVADGVLALVADGVRYRPVHYRRKGKSWKKTELSGTHAPNIDRWAVSRDGETLIYRHSTATTPPQWYRARIDAGAIVDEEPVTDLNPGYSGKPTGRVEVILWPGALDEMVEGILHYPLEWQEGKLFPLILDIHGGPASADRDSWDQWWPAPSLLWRQRGAFVLQVNYHGSSNYGLDWVESIGGGKYYELEIPDIEAGVDHVISLGLADPDRLACAGWSNGGILCADLITRTGRYRAASIGAADVEWISDWANVDFGAAFDNYYLGASPLDDPQIYLEKSPFFRLPGVTTPTIIYTGTEDRNVPPHQSWSLFRALQQTGKTDTRLVLFPGEPHGLRKIAHQRRKMEEDLAWFDRYLLDRPGKGMDWLKEGTPLEMLFDRSMASRLDGAFGIEAQESLIPETVAFLGLTVGRFEVTRAQFAAFDPSVEVRPGTENLPMTGVTFERARAYTRWLASTTGDPYRLPTIGEARRLAKAAGNSGNTLDHWAGYSANPEDVEMIRGAVALLDGAAPLLLPVGSFPGAGEDPVFDLDGNAAEWVVEDKGKGVPFGPSADHPREFAENNRGPGIVYVGFRIAVDL